jgi:streptogramin lyase
MAGRRYRPTLAVATLIAVAACGSGAAPSASGPVPARSQPAATVTAAPTAPTASPVVLAAPAGDALEPRQTLDLADVWVFIPTSDGIWTVTDPGDALVLRDPGTGREIRRIEGAAPFHGTAIAFGAAWATDYDRSVLHRYDLGTGKHTQIAVGAGPDAILATEEAIWVADHAGDSVERLDPTTLGITRIQVRDASGRGGPGGMVAAGGSLWLTVPLLDPTGGVHPPGALVEIDPAAARLARSIELDMIPCGIAAWADRVWVDACGDVSPAIAWLDMAGQAPRVISLADSAYLGGFLGGREWLLHDGQLLAIDRDTLRVVDGRKADRPILSVVPDGEDVWLGLEDRVMRVAADDFRR